MNEDQFNGKKKRSFRVIGEWTAQQYNKYCFVDWALDSVEKHVAQYRYCNGLSMINKLVHVTRIQMHFYSRRNVLPFDLLLRITCPWFRISIIHSNYFKSHERSYRKLENILCGDVPWRHSPTMMAAAGASVSDIRQRRPLSGAPEAH